MNEASGKHSLMVESGQLRLTVAGLIGPAFESSFYELACDEVKFASKVPIERDAIILCQFGMELPAKKGIDSLVHSTAAVVHWSRKIGDEYFIGARLRYPLNLASHNTCFAQLRAELRYEVEFVVGLRNLQSPYLKPVVVQDYSSSGCSFVSNFDLKAGTHGQFLGSKDHPESEIPMMISWKQQISSTCYLFGAECSGFRLANQARDLEIPSWFRHRSLTE